MSPAELGELIDDRLSRGRDDDGLAFVMVMPVGTGTSVLGVRGETLSSTPSGRNVGFTYKQLPRMKKALEEALS